MLEIRPCRDRADEDVSLEVYNRVWPWDAITMTEVDAFKRQMLGSVDILALLDGVPAGSVVAARMPQKPDVGLLILTVANEHRRRGAGTALYRAGSGWLAEHGLTETEALVPEDDPGSLAWAQRRGFREVQRNGRMVLELADVYPAPIDPPPGVDIVAFAERPELRRGIYEVAAESMSDIPGDEDYVIEPLDEWFEHHMEGPGDRPDATFVAVTDGEAIGWAKFSFTAARPTTASHDLTAVRRAWRGKGVAGALKRAQIAWAKANGYERLVTQNEMRNEPIRRLNERLGYRSAPGRVIVRGPLALS